MDSDDDRSVCSILSTFSIHSDYDEEPIPYPSVILSGDDDPPVFRIKPWIQDPIEEIIESGSFIEVSDLDEFQNWVFNLVQEIPVAPRDPLDSQDTREISYKIIASGERDPGRWAVYVSNNKEFYTKPKVVADLTVSYNNKREPGRFTFVYKENVVGNTSVIHDEIPEN